MESFMGEVTRNRTDDDSQYNCVMEVKDIVRRTFLNVPH